MIAQTQHETLAFGRQFAKTLSAYDIIALHGDLGAGKTIFTKGIITSLLSIEEREITSPTFTYMHMYEADFPIYHFDLYRIPNEACFIQMGFGDFLDVGLCLIEWPSKITSLLPKRTKHVHFHILDKEKRRIDVF